MHTKEVLVGEFFLTGLACLVKSSREPEIVKNFLLNNLCASRIVGEENIFADFGDTSIGRVAPIDSVFWWIILLMAYNNCSRDQEFINRPEVQTELRLIIKYCLSRADGSMITRTMDMHGYPIEIQALLFFALKSAHKMLKPDDGDKELIKQIEQRLTDLRNHIQTHYWLDFSELDNILSYHTKEHSHTTPKKFNVNPDSIPNWVSDFMTSSGGYFVGNVGPANVDFRWFLIGNCIAILSSLATPAQATAIMNLIEERWGDLIGDMPLKICYPEIEGHEWKIGSGCDPKIIRTVVAFN